jgi:CheY-specific phosphatase CheX
VEALQQSAREVLVAMASVTPRALDEQPEPTSLFRDEVIGLLGFTGDRVGHGRGAHDRAHRQDDRCAHADGRA